MNLKLLHENFIASSANSVIGGPLPVSPSTPRMPVVPMSAWSSTDDMIEKTFFFERLEDKSDMIRFLVDYEEDYGHYACISYTKSKVRVCLRTDKSNPDKSLDREYAKFADETYKSIVTLPRTK